MSNDVLGGVIEYARQAIRKRIEMESEKIVGEVVADVMSRLKFHVFDDVTRLKTEVHFTFEKNKEQE